MHCYVLYVMYVMLCVSPNCIYLRTRAGQLSEVLDGEMEQLHDGSIRECWNNRGSCVECVSVSVRIIDVHTAVFSESRAKHTRSRLVDTKPLNLRTSPQGKLSSCLPRDPDRKY
jgi:hypothetical protein